MTSDLLYETETMLFIQGGISSAQRPPLSLSTGPGNLAYRGISDLSISNTTTCPVVGRKRVNTGLGQYARYSDARHSCFPLKTSPPPTHIATSRPTAYSQLMMAELRETQQSFQA
jgi:hypothetical protein